MTAQILTMWDSNALRRLTHRECLLSTELARGVRGAVDAVRCSRGYVQLFGSSTRMRQSLAHCGERDQRQALAYAP